MEELPPLTPEEERFAVEQFQRLRAAVLAQEKAIQDALNASKALDTASTPASAQNIASAPHHLTTPKIAPLPKGKSVN